MSETTGKGRWDQWIPRSFILFFIGLAALEIWFVTMATRTFSGLVTDQAYVTGLNYNEILEQRAAEAKLGWVTDLDFAQGNGLRGAVTLAVADAEGQPVAIDEIRATAERMSRHPQIKAVEFSVQPGGFASADLAVPLAGRWFLRLRIARGEDVIHIIEEVDVEP